MLAELVDRYTWAKEDHDFVWTAAVITGRSPAQVVRVYGGNPTQPTGDYPFAQMRDLQGSGTPDPLMFHVQAFSEDSFTVAVEHNGWSGTIPEIARRCSADGGQYFSVFWNVHGTHYIMQAIDSVVTAYFDPSMAGPEPWPGWIYPEWLDLADFSNAEQLRPTCLAYMERQTGLAFDRYWLNERRPTYRIPDPDVMLKDVPNARDV